jgi:hypothetical protein
VGNKIGASPQDGSGYVASAQLAVDEESTDGDSASVRCDDDARVVGVTSWLAISSDAQRPIFSRALSTLTNNTPVSHGILHGNIHFRLCLLCFVLTFWLDFVSRRAFVETGRRRPTVGLAPLQLSQKRKQNPAGLLYVPIIPPSIESSKETARAVEVLLCPEVVIILSPLFVQQEEDAG